MILLNKFMRLYLLRLDSVCKGHRLHTIRVCLYKRVCVRERGCQSVLYSLHASDLCG